MAGVTARPMLARLAAAALFVASSAAAQPASHTVAMTFDDLPLVDASDAAADRAKALAANEQVQRALRRYAAPAIGFVNEAKVENLGPVGIAILKSWNRGPFELGNHGFAHLDTNDLTLPAIEQEIDRGELSMRPLAQGAGRSLRYYRFAFNHVGDTEEKRVAIEVSLARRGYRLAATTIDTSDYLFAKAYDRALAEKDAAATTRIEQAYLAYTREQIAYYGQLNARVLGYEPPEVMLLHLNRLNAATLERILQIFTMMHYSFVTLDKAQSDPAYARSPAVATKYGPMWGYRWARERGVKVDGSLEKDPPSWVAEYAAGK
jgi:peptidoglycan/xylan/chitin deacetylase (PgdA/CDA1 family)